MSGVFDFAVQPRSEDITRLYRFPNQAHRLEVVRECLGRWILYRETKRNHGRNAYVAVAHMVDIRPDPEDRNSCFAVMSGYLPFATPVPFYSENGYFEAAFQSVKRRLQIGTFTQHDPVRLISAAEYEAIVAIGFAQTQRRLKDADDIAYTQTTTGDVAQQGFHDDGPSARERRFDNRLYRDTTFRIIVCEAYEYRCALTGLTFTNGRERAEVEAAHILPVAADGPDIVTNGIALSRTAHWLFDNHMIAFDDSLQLLMHPVVRQKARKHLRFRTERLLLPEDRRLRPNQAFLAEHRRRFDLALATTDAPEPP